MKAGARAQGAALGVEPSAEVPVVELRLLPWRGIVAQHRGLLLSGLLGELAAHVAAQAGDAHRKAAFALAGAGGWSPGWSPAGAP